MKQGVDTATHFNAAELRLIVRIGRLSGRSGRLGSRTHRILAGVD
jgi:hypothetical protein